MSDIQPTTKEMTSIDKAYQALNGWVLFYLFASGIALHICAVIFAVYWFVLRGA